MAPEELQERVVRYVADLVGRPPEAIDVDQPLAVYGIESVEAAALAVEVEGWLGRTVAVDVVYRHPTIERLVDHLTGAAPVRSEAPVGAWRAEPLAVVGIGCRVPGADGPDELWSLLGQPVPPEPTEGRRWPWSAGDEWDEAARSAGVVGRFLDDISGFDANFFGVSAREAERMDPQQRLLLEVAWEALEDAGIPAASLRGSDAGVFVGVATNEYSRLQGAGPATVDAHLATGNALSVVANRLSYVLDLRGPSLAVDTACSSSLVALHLAGQSLRCGETSTAIVGGVSLILTPALHLAFESAGVLSPTGGCRPFQADADGYVRGEGAGVVVVRRLADALADGQRVYAVVSGTAMNQDGRTNGLLAPNPDAQVRVVEQALRQAGRGADEVDYVEAHGTGTALGDEIELGALARVFGPGRAAPVVVDSIKSRIGHLEAAAGIIGLIKAVLALWQGALPPAVGWDAPASVALRSAAGILARPGADLERPGPGIAGVSSFGFGGTNAHVIAERWAGDAGAAPVAPAARFRSQLLLPLSTKGRGALPVLAGRWADAIEGLDDADLEAAAATAATGRDHLGVRLTVQAGSKDQLVSRLRELGDGRRPDGCTTGVVTGRESGPLVMVFPGHGAAWAGLPEDVAVNPAVAALVAGADEYLEDALGLRLGATLADGDLSAPAQQARLVVAQAALAAWWAAIGVRPDLVIGHSAGEIAAAHVAGCLSLEDALELAVARGEAIAAHAPAGAAALVALGAADLADRGVGTGPDLWVAAANGPGQSVVAGPAEAVDAFLAACLDEGVFGNRLEVVGYPAHTPLLAGAGEALAAATAGVVPRVGRATLLSTVTGQVSTGDDLDSRYWAANLVQPVRFDAALECAVAAGATTFLECHPRPALASAFTGREAPLELVGSAAREVPLAASLLRAAGRLHCAGRRIAWEQLTGGAARRVPLPKVAWERRQFWYPRPQVAAATAAGPGLLTELPPGTPGERRWSFALPGDLAEVLGDHRVEGRAVVPAAAQLEVALQVLRGLGWADDHDLVDVRFRHLLTVDDARDGVVVVLREDGGAPALEIRPAGREEAVFSAVVSAGPAVAPPSPIDAGAPAIEVTEVYAELERLGLHYGPAFRGLTAVRGGADGVAGHISLPARGQVAAALVAHPVVVDSCLHAIAAAMLGEAAPRLLVPVAASRVRCRSSLGEHVDVVAHRRAGGWDVDVRGAAGGSLLIEGLVLAPNRPAAASERPALSVYTVDYVDADPPGDVAPTSSVGDPWIVLADAGGVGHRLAAAVEARGERCVVLDRAGCDEQGGPTSGVLAAALGARFGDGPRRCGRIVHLWPLDQDTSLEEAVAHGPAVVPALLRAFIEAEVAGAPQIVLVTTGATAPTAASATGWPVGGMSLGFGAAVAVEAPDLECLVLDVDADDPERLARRLLDAIDDDGGENRLVLGADGSRRVPRLVPLDERLAASGRRRGTWIVSGGLGALGMRTAEALAVAGAEELLLIGRRPPTGAGEARIDGLRTAGTGVRVVACDVGDRDALADVLDRARATMAPLRGVVHAAGVLEDAALGNLTPDLLARVARPKVAGGWHLHELTSDDDLDAFVLFSSAVSVLGSPGQAAYAAANGFLDALAHHRRAAGRPATTVNWGPWAGGGLVEGRADREVVQLAKMIDPDEGVALLGRLLEGQQGQYVVLPTDVAALVQHYPVSRGIRFFGRCVDGAAMALRGRGESTRAYVRPDLAEEYVEPEGLERAVADVWRTALSIDRVGAVDSLFELGGDSVLAGQVLARINQRYDVRIDPERLYDDFTVRNLARLVEDALIARVAALTDYQVLEALTQEDV